MPFKWGEKKQERKSSVQLSLPTSRVERGHEIKRLPIRGYLNAIELLKDAPQALMEACFPGDAPENVLLALGKMSRDDFIGIAVQAMAAVPMYAARLFSQLSEIPEDVLLDNRDIGLDGIAEMVEAWWEVNGIGNFTERLKVLLDAPLKAIQSFLQPSGGFND
jgi:hypothetical protein